MLKTVQYSTVNKAQDCFLCSGPRNREKFKISVKYSLKVTLRNVTSRVKIKYRKAFVFSYELYENPLIGVISIDPSTNLTPILYFPIFRKKQRFAGTYFEHYF